MLMGHRNRPLLREKAHIRMKELRAHSNTLSEGRKAQAEQRQGLDAQYYERCVIGACPSSTTDDSLFHSFTATGRGALQPSSQ